MFTTLLLLALPGFAAVSFEAVAQEQVAATDSEEVTVAAPITYQDAVAADAPVDAGYGSSLDVCLTCGADVAAVTTNYDYAGHYSAPIEYAQ